MKILVPVKRVSDPDNANKIKVAPGGTTVTLAEPGWKPNPFDDWAVETALRLNENAANGQKLGEIVVASFGPADVMQQVRQFLAMGADRGILVECDDVAIDGWVVARGLAAIVAAEKPDLVIMGKQTADGEGGLVGPILAELLGWPMSTGTMSLEVEGDKITVTREADGGVVVQRLSAPAVITVTDRIVTPAAVKNGVSPKDHRYPESDSGRYASLKGIMQSKSKPVDQKKLDTLGIDTTVTSVYSGLETPPARSGKTTFVESVEQLVEKLHTEAKVI